MSTAIGLAKLAVMIAAASIAGTQFDKAVVWVTSKNA